MSEELTTTTEDTTGAAETSAEQSDPVDAKLHEAIVARKNDAEALALYTQELIDKKRHANAEAKKYREELESFRREVEEKEREKQLSEMSEAQKLQAMYEEAQEKIKLMEQTMQQQLANEFDLEVAYVTEKHRVKEEYVEYVEFLLEKHLTSLDEKGYTDELADFDVDQWMSSLKESKTNLFQGASETQPNRQMANMGLKPNQTETAVAGSADDDLEGIGRRRGDKAKLEAAWNKKKQELAKAGLLV